MKKFEQFVEKSLWNIRFIVILSVVFSILASITLFLLGSWEILQSIFYENPIFNANYSYNDLLFTIISSIDTFLIGIVLLILVLEFMNCL